MNNSRWVKFKFDWDRGVNSATCSVCGRVQEFIDKVALEMDCAKGCASEYQRRMELEAKEEAASSAKTGLLF